MRTIMAKRSKAAGVPGRVSGHSLRVGAAQSLAAAGASVVEMQQAGRWKSPSMPGQYARKQMARRGGPAVLQGVRLALRQGAVLMESGVAGTASRYAGLAALVVQAAE